MNMRKIFVILCTLILLAGLLPALFAQETPPVPPIPESGTAAVVDGAPADELGASLSGVEKVLIDLAVKHTWIFTAVLVIGVLRTCVKPLMTVAHNIVGATSTKTDDLWLERIETSRGWRWFVFGLDWLASVKLVRR